MAAGHQATHRTLPRHLTDESRYLFAALSEHVVRLNLVLVGVCAVSFRRRPDLSSILGEIRLSLRLIATFLCLLPFVCEAGGQSANDAGPLRIGSGVSPADAYRGVYRFDDGRLVAIEYALEGKEPHFVDFATGRFGALYAETETRFVAGPGMLIREPVEIRVTFEAGALRWQEEGQAARRARRLNLREEEVRFSNGEVELAGTLIRPLGKGLFPAGG